MVRVRNFEYTFRALGIEPIVGDFWWFYQLSVSIGFFLFRQRDHTPKLMIPPKGMTKWKTKFFYVKAAAITAKLQFRNVTGTIITENISVPTADTVDWFPTLHIIVWVKLDNRQLWVLRIMIGRLSRNARPVLRENSGEEAPLWRMFCPDFKGKVEILTYAEGEEGWNRTIIGNFRMPDQAALNAVLPEGKGDLGALGDPAVAGVPKQTVLKFSDKRQRKTKKPHEAVVVPPLVPEVAGIPRTRLRKYDGYVVVSDTLEGLGVPGGAAAAGGSTTGAEPVDVKKRRRDAPVASGQKAPKLRKTRATAVPKPKPSVTTGKLEETIRLRAEAEAMVKATREGAEQLEKDKAAFEKLKQTETWAASAGLKQVRSLAKLLSDERKGWREACARENEKLFCVRQELNNLKAANAALVKEKATVEAAAKEAEARGAKALKDAEADRIKLNKVVEELKVEVQNRVTIIEEVSARATEAEARSREAEEARYGLATSLS
ncbi:hypothetical protein HanPI659440_Chr15g0594911 [Helianthus annuus]|nr:hypothetical protein HanPI659440_Chr15g0594911 [Helianthus annuus]